ncbi:hypothetical protein [Natronosalvus rutilus]|uniref:Uncharacterized protein n=1 Tax=Natronosalvus rutilus TaxID=2953753 RepID=A0A9E7NDP5_9EURY|nr:hypothetical protein [Natronosalvus rutilus]UTF55965.1 hypothetical protein NGM29_20960 [Natronosalvus rutilus]
MSDDFPTPDGVELADETERPGEPLYPGTHTIVDRENEALTQGEVIQVWFETYADGFGTELVTAELLVIGDDGEGDIFAVPAHQDFSDTSRVYRLAGDLETIQAGYVIPVPDYDHEEGVLTVTREVMVQGNPKNDLIEARSQGIEGFWTHNGREL